MTNDRIKEIDNSCITNINYSGKIAGGTPFCVTSIAVISIANLSLFASLKGILPALNTTIGTALGFGLPIGTGLLSCGLTYFAINSCKEMSVRMKKEKSDLEADNDKNPYPLIMKKSIT